MVYCVSPKVSSLKKFTSWFLGLYNASVYALGDEDTMVEDDIASNSLPFVTSPFLLKSILFSLIVTFIVSYTRTRSSRPRLPPQPSRIPIIGNLFQLADKRWLFSRECKERFGEYLALL